MASPDGVPTPGEPVIGVRRSAERYCVEHDGITTWHCFSAGAYYDPDNVALGRLVACDTPGAMASSTDSRIRRLLAAIPAIPHQAQP